MRTRNTIVVLALAVALMLPTGGRSLRDHLDQVFRDLLTERTSSWDPVVRDIANQIAPYRVSWSHTPRNDGTRRDDFIINNTPIRALGALSAYLMAGITSPARQWFKLSLADKDLAEHRPVKIYLDQCRKILEASFQTSNFYNELANGTYVDLPGFGTAAMFAEEGKHGFMRYRSMPWGEYVVAVDYDGNPYILGREFKMSALQIVKKFGYAACSAGVQDSYRNGRYNMTYTVRHMVLPNEEYNPGYDGPSGMPFQSCWWETKSPDQSKMLRQSGYYEFPAMIPKWSGLSGEAYGRGPGHECRGDCRALQHYERQLTAIVDKITDPPLEVNDPTVVPSLFAGDVTYTPRGSEQTVKAIQVVNPQAVKVMQDHIQRHEGRIHDAFYTNVLLTLMMDERAQRPTATEVEATKAESMLQMGPLLENMDSGLLDPVVTRAFAVHERAGVLPDPPPELVGVEMQVEFISVMHQAQRATGIGAVRAFMAEVSTIAQIRPDVIDKVDADAMIDDIATITGVRPDFVLDKRAVTKVREAKATRQQAQETGAAMVAGAKGVKDLSGADPERLSQIASAISPAAAAQSGAGGLT